MTPTEKAQALVDHGLCDTFDEAVHMLADMGDIDSSEHEEMLSDEEAARVYGDRALHGAMYTTYEQAAEALATAELDVIGDFGEDGLEAGYADIVHSIASCCSPEVAAELIRRKL